MWQRRSVNYSVYLGLDEPFNYQASKDLTWIYNLFLSPKILFILANFKIYDNFKASVFQLDISADCSAALR